MNKNTKNQPRIKTTYNENGKIIKLSDVILVNKDHIIVLGFVKIPINDMECFKKCFINYCGLLKTKF